MKNRPDRPRLTPVTLALVIGGAVATAAALVTAWLLWFRSTMGKQSPLPSPDGSIESNRPSTDPNSVPATQTPGVAEPSAGIDQPTVGAEPVSRGGSCDDQGCQNACDTQISSACSDVGSGACDSAGACDSGADILSAGVSTAVVLPLIAVKSFSPTGRKSPSRKSSPAARATVRMIHGYRRWVSPRTTTRCRYIPRCSQYGVSTIEKYGLRKGSRLAVARIRRCTTTVPQNTVDAPP